MYAKGMTTRDIQDILADMHGTEINPSLISRITDRVLPRLEEWQSRPLQERYVIVWFDCIFYKVRHNGKVEIKAIYVLIGLGLDGKKELLDFWINKRESSSFWLGVLNELKGCAPNKELTEVCSMERAERGTPPVNCASSS